jgi:hypothetical protein
VDRLANRQLERAWPPLERSWRRLRATAGPPARRIHALVGSLSRWAGGRLRAAGVLLFRLLSALEKELRGTLAMTVRAATRASAVLTPQRAICAVIVASAACLAVSQFVDYRAVEVGQPGYAGLPAATPPTVGVERAGQPHLYLLLPVALLAAALAAVALATGRRRLGRFVFALGLLSLAVILLVDLPAALDTAAQASRFSGTSAVLDNGFYAELASSAGLMLGGLLLARKPRARGARVRRRQHRPRGPRLARFGGASRRKRGRFAHKRGDAPAAQPDEGLQRPALHS